MVKAWHIMVLAYAATELGTEAFAQFPASPAPEVFARAQDQQRARQIRQPCTPADEENACYRHDGRLIGEAPCTYHIEPGVIGSLPTDQCYKMDSPRRYRGVWIDAFEGQQFIPEGTTIPAWPSTKLDPAEWKKHADHVIAAMIWLDVERTELGHDWQRGGRRMFLEFVGRKTMYPGHYGHMGMSGQEIIVDHVISQRQCPETGACR